MLSIEAIRYSFFRPPGHGGRTLRFEERSPEGPCEEGQLCICTEAVRERPPGFPVEVKQEILATGTLPDGLRARHILVGNYAPWFTFEWGEATVRKQPEHAFFIFGRMNNCLRVEVTMPGYGPTNCFFGNLFFGPNVDTSKLMNHHMPSRIVKTAEIAPRRLWVHECIFGGEAMSFLPDGKEANFWWDLKGQVDAIAEGVKADPKWSPEQTRLMVEARPELLGLIDQVSGLLASVVRNLKTTELFRECYKVNRDAQRAMRDLDLQRRRNN